MERALFIALNRGAANPVLDWLMPRITNLHQQSWFLAVVVLLALYLLWRGDRRVKTWIVCAGMAVGVSDLACKRVIKEIIPRFRPCHLQNDVGPMEVPETRIVPGEHCPGSYSFPSNHASNMMALAGVCWWFSRRKPEPGDAEGGESRSGRWKPWLWFVIPLIIGYSRIYLGFHYPSDVIGGWVLGGLIAAGLVALSIWFYPQKTAINPLRSPSNLDG